MANQNSGNFQNSEAVIDARRQTVASLLIRTCATVAQVHDTLAKDRSFWNPNSAPPAPWSYATIAEDCRELRREWQEQARADTAAHQSRILREIQEIKVEAWAKNRLTVVLNALEREMRLLGLGSGENLEAPTQPYQYATREEFEQAALERFRLIQNLHTKRPEEQN